MPCCHAVACAFFLRHKAELYVSEYLTKVAYLKSYKGCIGPVVGEKHWPTSDLQIQPPPIKIGPGRPKKNRKKDPHEDPKNHGRLTRHGYQMTCSLCKLKGHNKRKCPDKGNFISLSAPPKRKKGRPRGAYTRMEIDDTNVTCSTSIHYGRSAEPATRIGRVRAKGRPRGSGIARGKANSATNVNVSIDSNSQVSTSNICPTA